MFEQVVLLVISFLANTFSAFSGGGAGLIQFPALIFLGLPFSIALATHKIASVALGLGAVLRHRRTYLFHPRLVAAVLIGGLPGVLLGAWVIVEVHDNLATTMLGILTLSLGIYSICSPNLGAQVTVRHLHGTSYLTGLLVLFVIGVLNGSLSSGSGLFVTLWLVSWFGLDYRQAVAITLVYVGIFWNGTGAVVLNILSSVQWSWLPALLLGSLAGGYLGAHLSIVKSNRMIKRAFETITLLIGLKLLFQGTWT
ncbi:MAG: sulfite exporter TauE/SafE family protein [Gammaproteobacteria bacterium]|nr:MAG: sulfite exporter TauE/SafE family protein [Gammaproteobacteria bacterium]